MVDKKRLGLIAGLIVTILVLLALVFYKLFPTMKKHCIGMCEKMEAAGIDLPPMGKWMMRDQHAKQDQGPVK